MRSVQTGVVFFVFVFIQKVCRKLYLSWLNGKVFRLRVAFVEIRREFQTALNNTIMIENGRTNGIII